ncbi:MAG: hypothetical protein ABIM40_11730 [Pseudomonadota bacterium]
MEKGDLTADGNVDMADATAGLRLSAGMDVPGVSVLGDVDADGAIGVGDVLFVLQILAGEYRSTTQFWEEWEDLPDPGKDSLGKASVLWGGSGFGLYTLEGSVSVSAHGEEWTLLEGQVTLQAPGDIRKTSVRTGNLGPTLGLPPCTVEVNGSAVTVNGPTKTLGVEGYVQGSKTHVFTGFADAQGRNLEVALAALAAESPPAVSPDDNLNRCGQSPTARIYDGRVFSVADDRARQILIQRGGVRESDLVNSSLFTSFLRAENMAMTCCVQGIVRPYQSGDATIIDATYNQEAGKWEGSWTTCSWADPGRDCSDSCETGDCAETLCTDQADNDADTISDCADTDCNLASCGDGCQCRNSVKSEINCADGFDNDGDGLFDCDDPDCAGVPCGAGCACGQAETCADGIDNDGDRQVDCADADCDAQSCGTDCLCQGGQAHEQNCADGIDNDGDLMVDCEDGADCNGRSCGDGKVCGGGACQEVPFQGWGTAVPIQTAGLYFADPSLAVMEDGRAMLVCRHYDSGTMAGSVYAVHYAPGQEWGEPELISENQTGNISYPLVAMDQAGNAVVIWVLDGDLKAKTYDRAAGTWGQETRIDADTGTVFNWVLAVDPAGNAMVLWAQYDNLNQPLLKAVYARKYSPGSGWGAFVEIHPGEPDTGGQSYALAVGMDASGNAEASWFSFDQWAYYNYLEQRHYTLYAKHFSAPSGTWGQTQELAEKTCNSRQAHPMVIHSGGNGVMVWQESTCQDPEVWLKGKRCAGGSWGNLFSIANGGGRGIYDMDMHENDAGRAVAVWTRPDESNLLRVYASDYTAGSGWSAYTRIDQGVGHAYAPKVIVDKDGNAATVWTQNDGATVSVYASRLETGGEAWSAPRDIDAGTTGSTAISLGTDQEGNVTAVWTHSNGTVGTVYVNRFVNPQ